MTSFIPDNLKTNNGKFYDAYEEGATNKPDNRNNELNFWLNAAKKYPGEILEIACGTGRITSFLARHGFKITGLDYSLSMLETAKEKAPDIDWINADMRKFNINKNFDLIFIPYNSFLYLLTIDDAITCLECIRNHLKPKGKFILDIAHISPQFLLNLLLPNSQLEYVTSVFQNPFGNETIIGSRERKYEAANQTLQLIINLNFLNNTQQPFQEVYNFRLYFPQEIDLLLRHAGFAVKEKYGNYRLAPFDSDSVYQLIVCDRP
jgi:ubiquinone/menaquinone biosynthesis C-methylase UbiE